MVHCEEVSELTYLNGNLLLVLAREIHKMVVLGADQERNGCFVKPTALAVPLLDGVESALAREIKHEEDGHGVVADKWQHVDEFALASQVPNREGDFRVADRDGFFHEVDACQLISLDLILFIIFLFWTQSVPNV